VDGCTTLRRRRPVKTCYAFWLATRARSLGLPTLGDRLLSEVPTGIAGANREDGSGRVGTQNNRQLHADGKTGSCFGSGCRGRTALSRKWNHDFVGMPIVQKEQQHRPSLTETEVVEILASTSKRYASLFAVLAGTGLRIGEAQALKATDFTSDCRVLRVSRSVCMVRSKTLKHQPQSVRLI